MAWFRDIKRRFRRDVHQRMRVPAYYFVDEKAKPQLVFVRVHSKLAELGDMAGTNFHHAVVRDILPSILFMRDEVAMPARNSLLSISDSEAYRIDSCDPPDDISIKAYVSQLSVKDIANMKLSVPDVALIEA